MKSNVLLFFILCLSFFGNIGCGDQWSENMRDKHIIPYTPIYTEIDIRSADFQRLNNTNESVLIKTSNTARVLGYNGHGIIVINAGSLGFKCWDATCTNCTELTSSFPNKNVQGATAICPICKSEFELFYGQRIKEGDNPNNSKIYPLKEYPVTKTGNILKISY